MVGNKIIYSLTHSWEFTIEMLCGKQNQGKNIYSCGAHFDLCSLSYSIYQKKKEKHVSVKLI
jgi:hypothetical protein